VRGQSPCGPGSEVAAVGCLVDSCRTCPARLEGDEPFCAGPATFTDSSPDTDIRGATYGSHSDSLAGDKKFALRPSNLPELSEAGAELSFVSSHVCTATKRLSAARP
jgi:D-arabinose 1-dehydrogenase-like Zn-dependent alcohol dehydrogenase